MRVCKPFKKKNYLIKSSSTMKVLPQKNNNSTTKKKKCPSLSEFNSQISQMNTYIEDLYKKYISTKRQRQMKEQNEQNMVNRINFLTSEEKKMRNELERHIKKQKSKKTNHNLSATNIFGKSENNPIKKDNVKLNNTYIENNSNKSNNSDNITNNSGSIVTNNICIIINRNQQKKKNNGNKQKITENISKPKKPIKVYKKNKCKPPKKIAENNVKNKNSNDWINDYIDPAKNKKKLYSSNSQEILENRDKFGTNNSFYHRKILSFNKNQKKHTSCSLRDNNENIENYLTKKNSNITFKEAIDNKKNLLGINLNNNENEYIYRKLKSVLSSGKFNTGRNHYPYNEFDNSEKIINNTTLHSRLNTSKNLDNSQKRALHLSPIANYAQYKNSIYFPIKKLISKINSNKNDSGNCPIIPCECVETSFNELKTGGNNTKRDLENQLDNNNYKNINNYYSNDIDENGNNYNNENSINYFINNNTINSNKFYKKINKNKTKNFHNNLNNGAKINEVLNPKFVKEEISLIRRINLKIQNMKKNYLMDKDKENKNKGYKKILTGKNNMLVLNKNPNNKKINSGKAILIK